MLVQAIFPSREKRSDAMDLTRLSPPSTLAVLLMLLCAAREIGVLRRENAELQQRLLQAGQQLQRRLSSKDCDPCTGADGGDGIGTSFDRKPWSDARRRQALHELSAISWFDANWSRALPSTRSRLNLQLHSLKLALCLEHAGDPDTKKQGGNMEACIHTKHPMQDASALTRERDLNVRVNGKVLSVDDIAYGMEMLFQQRHMHSQITFLGVAMQQDPNDAIVIADLLWRVRPRLLIELGTSGGGSALFYARTMRGYDPHARVLTVDPSSDTEPMENWNHHEIRKFCSHCHAANSTATWKAAVTFLRELPTAPAALSAAREHAAAATAAGLPVMVMEDSNHKFSSVAANIASYASFVTRGSYLIVQDTRGGRYSGPTRAISDFLQMQPQVHTPRRDAGGASCKFVRDRRPEYLLFSQHTGGFLRCLEAGEEPGPHDELS